MNEEQSAPRPRLPRIRPRAMAFDMFFLFVNTLVVLTLLVQFFLIVWPLVA